MVVGYARTSTVEQRAGLDAQLRALTAAGCERVFQEQTSSLGKRPELEAALSYVRDGDTVVVTKIDRLARSTQHLLQIVDRLDRKSVALRILDFGGTAVDTTRAIDKLLITVIGAISEFERNLMLERQREGVARAKAEGRYKGRKPTARAKADEIRALADEGLKKVLSPNGLGSVSGRCFESWRGDWDVTYLARSVSTRLRYDQALCRDIKLLAAACRCGLQSMRANIPAVSPHLS
jgi:DNA invertase Pin-like site-specific DNA recombinase